MHGRTAEAELPLLVKDAIRRLWPNRRSRKYVRRGRKTIDPDPELLPCSWSSGKMPWLHLGVPNKAESQKTPHAATPNLEKSYKTRIGWPDTRNDPGVYLQLWPVSP